MAKDGAKKVAIIGGGLGGLSAACTLAARGHEVTLFERNDWLGGKAAELKGRGFRFDMGPTILTMPSVLRRIFSEAGRELEKELELVRLDLQWGCFFEDGSRLDLIQDVKSMADSVAAFTGKPSMGEQWLAFMDLAKKYDKITNDYFFYKAVGTLGDTFRLPGVSIMKLLRDLTRIGSGGTMAGTLRHFLKDARVFQMSEHFTQYVGSSPRLAPPILCGIAHMQASEGVWYPIGGTRAVPLALAALAKSLGADLRPGASVMKILVEGGRAVGVETADGRAERFDAVVSNMDSVRTHTELIGGAPAKRFMHRRSYEPACSGVVLYFGLDRRYDHIPHHSFVFSRDTDEEYDAIYGQGKPAPDPTCYICAPARTEAAVAPPGGEALYVLVHTPYIRDGHDWNALFPRYRKVILEKLARTAGLDGLEKRVVFEGALKPTDIHARYSVLNGAIYGLASHGRFFGAFKPGNRSRDLKGLYLAGGSAHPGPGMPMALMSGWIAADALDADRKEGRL